jgi:MFS family permease
VSHSTSGGSLALLGNREFLALAGAAFARSQAYSTILIALALYADIFETTGFVEGLFGTAFALAQVVIVLPLGRYIDLGNSKRYLLVGLLLNVAVFVGFSLVGTVEHVILVRVVQGLGASMLWLTGTAVVGEISPGESRGLWLGTFNQVGAISSLAGDVFGGLLLYIYGFQTTYAVLIVVTALAVVAVFLFLRDDPGGHTDPGDASGLSTLQELLDRTAVRALVTFRLAFSVGKMAVIIFLPIYARTGFAINPLAIGAILAGGKLTKSVFQGWVGGLTDRIPGTHRFVLAGALVYALGTAMIPLAEYADGFLPGLSVGALGHSMALPPAFFALFGAYAVLGVADSLRLPASMALFVAEGERVEAVASSLSLRSISWKVGQLAGPVLVGVVWDLTSVLVAFLTAAGFIVVSAGVFARMYATNADADAPSATPGD